jgi:hypothetical protein
MSQSTVEHHLRMTEWRIRGLRKDLTDALAANPNCDDSAKSSAQRAVKELSGIVDHLAFWLDELPHEPHTRGVLLGRLAEVTEERIRNARIGKG